MSNTNQPLNPLRRCCGTPRGKGPHRSSCHQAFTPPSRSLAEDFDKGGISKATRREILDDVYGDLPDGAYLAVAEEMGLSVEDLMGD